MPFEKSSGDTTKFAPSPRSTREDLEADHRLVVSEKTLVNLLTAVSSNVAVLNPQRQVVFASEDFLKFRGLTLMAPLLGLRPGEVMNCVHSLEEPGGCGTSESCTVCGAINTIWESQISDSKVTKDWRITVKENEGLGTLDLEVTATPWVLSGRNFTVLTVKDVSSDKRKNSLERIFFHDIVNTLGGLNGILELLADYSDLNEGKELLDLSQKSSQDALEEILSFRQLRMAETGELNVLSNLLDPDTILDEVVSKLKFHPVAEGKMIEIDTKDSFFKIYSDRILLERVLINMLKNALEAVPKGSTVVIGFRSDNSLGLFWVKNPGEMSRPVQLQVFQRSFSTKGTDRGLGTYSMRLLGEGYLGGRVGFTSKDGFTEFFISLPIQSGL